MNFVESHPPPVPAYQNTREFGAVWDLVASRPHARILEIGSLYGGTLWWWGQLPKIKTLVAVDLPSDWEQIRADVIEARTSWPGWFDHLRFVDLQADSRDPGTVTAVEKSLRGSAFDVAFIDGDHTYEGVRADWLAYSPLVRPGGLVAFHDTWPNGDQCQPGVVAWVDELRHHLPSIEFTDPDGVGICAFTMP